MQQRQIIRQTPKILRGPGSWVAGATDFHGIPCEHEALGAGELGPHLTRREGLFQRPSWSRDTNLKITPAVPKKKKIVRVPNPASVYSLQRLERIITRGQRCTGEIGCISNTTLCCGDSKGWPSQLYCLDMLVPVMRVRQSSALLNKKMAQN